jgi:hypothetical protein
LQFKTHIDFIAIASIERFAVVREQGLDVSQTRYLELLGLLFNHLSVEGADQAGGVEKKRALGKGQVALLNGLEVLPGYSGLADGSGRQIQQPVAVVLDFGEKLGNTRLRPVLAENRQNVSKHVRPVKNVLALKGQNVETNNYLVMVPSISLITILSSHRQRYTWHLHLVVPW